MVRKYLPSFRAYFLARENQNVYRIPQKWAVKAAEERGFQDLGKVLVALRSMISAGLLCRPGLIHSRGAQIQEFSRNQKMSRGEVVDAMVSWIPHLSVQPKRIPSIKENVRLSVRVRPETRALLDELKKTHTNLGLGDILNWVVASMEEVEKRNVRHYSFLKKIFSNEDKNAMKVVIF